VTQNDAKTVSDLNKIKNTVPY